MKKETDFHKEYNDVYDMGMNIPKIDDTSFDKKINAHKNPTIAIIKSRGEKHRNLGILNMNNLKMNSNQHYKTS